MAHTRMLLLAAALLLWTGCYAVRPSSGAGQTGFTPPRLPDPGSVALPDGYHINVVAKGLTFPTAVVFDAEGTLHVVESGYSYGEEWTTARLLRILPNGGLQEIASGDRNGPWTGGVFYEGNFFIAEGSVLNGGRILKVTPDGEITTVVDGLPSFGDHHTDGPALSPDGWIYFGQGTASNSGVVGPDNLEYGWLERFPEFHDIPARDIVLRGVNFETEDLLQPGSRQKVETGAFLPFGTPAGPGQRIEGRLKSGGSILRVRPDGSGLELVAWGFRNPFGLAFAPNGDLYVTENSYDDRGSRPVWGTPDLLWRIEPGLWYGWPDFAGGIPLTDPRFKPPGGKQPEFLLAEHPNPPPQPITRFGVHSAAVGLDFSASARFGYMGEAFVALFGDEAPVVGKVLHPVGCKVVRVNVETGEIHDFAINRGPVNAPASKLKSGGLERPVSVRFGPRGDDLYVVDFGVLLHDAKGAHPVAGTGVVWRIFRK